MLGHLVIAVCCITAVMPVPARVYDQRQTGDLNVQIELKDLQVVALLDSELLEDYTDYDYFYDYADFTIKPSNRPTTSTTTKTTEKNDTAEVTEPSIIPSSFISTLIDIVNSTELNATSLNDKETPNADPSNGTVNSTSNAGSDESQSSEEDGESGTVVIAPSTTVKPVHALRSQKRCKSGYIPNGRGRCRRASRRRLSLLPL
ncbi:uncharacterized protein [Linepithema humile]|uniref:uncharacterized protein n=1 Tax=Linepithema humile TaxID=83485 RepID=UPI000623A388|nr:PREDICTED: uncharacterized protein LOC105678888 [Linepithema humile]